ncbi:MFS transporter [Paenibacillus sp. P96]|uniref:MFS transporter n=1 Tax=Paenibacillus zeirhizosphaerae TaxID=2987519 RepID=A0ABT9FNB6_9BACL|nr:MFS transporter [Paenibacillus sp. P96]MDP4096220.1 MFS transporter [Paenibacillus sp. P96]
MKTEVYAEEKLGARKAGGWRSRPFRLMFAAHAMASLGDWFDAIAIQVLIAYRWGVDPMIIALIPIVIALPGLVLGSFAGALADRIHQARLMMACDLIAALLTVLILFAPDIAWLLPLLATRATAGVFQLPAQQGLTRRVVADGELLQASSWNGLANQSAKVAGPLLGAVTLALLSPQASIMLNALMRLSSCALLWPLRRIGGAADAGDGGQEPVKEHFLAEWRAGWTLLLGNRLLLSTLLFIFMGMTAILMIDYQFAVLLRYLAPGNESLMGWLISALGFGGVGSMLIMRRFRHVSPGWGLGGGALLIGCGIAALGLMRPGVGLPVILVVGMMIGIGNGVSMITQTYILQTGTPAAMVGRVFGIQSTLMGMIMITAPLLGGVWIQEAGVSAAFFWIGLSVACMGFGGVLLRFRMWGRMDKGELTEKRGAL